MDDPQQAGLNDPQQAGTYVAWHEYYVQLSRRHKYVRGRGNGPWEHKNLRFFEQIAKQCIAKQLNIIQYIEAAFMVLEGMDRRAITAADLADARLISMVDSALNGVGAPADWPEYWAQQQRQLARLRQLQPDAYPDAAAALMVPSNGFDAWFRVLALQPMDEELFQAYGMAAHEELQGKRTLRDFLRQKVPQSMTMFERRTARFADG